MNTEDTSRSEVKIECESSNRRNNFVDLRGRVPAWRIPKEESDEESHVATPQVGIKSTADKEDSTGGLLRDLLPHFDAEARQKLEDHALKLLAKAKPEPRGTATSSADLDDEELKQRIANILRIDPIQNELQKLPKCENTRIEKISPNHSSGPDQRNAVYKRLVKMSTEHSSMAILIGFILGALVLSLGRSPMFNQFSLLADEPESSENCSSPVISNFSEDSSHKVIVREHHPTLNRRRSEPSRSIRHNSRSGRLPTTSNRARAQRPRYRCCKSRCRHAHISSDLDIELRRRGLEILNELIDERGLRRKSRDIRSD